ncbi:3-demethylubiquinone-9 3-methyltransferase domain containing protein [Naviculisporaceae sp. PSN 640]
MSSTAEPQTQVQPTTSNSTPQAKLTTVLWFNTSEHALSSAKFYTTLFPSSRITHTQYYTSAGESQHGQTPGDVMVVAYTLFENHPIHPPLYFANLNGGATPGMHFTGAISFQIDCEDQEEIDMYWNALGEGGDESRQMCGWVEDRFGVTWQVVPRELKVMLMGGEGEVKNSEGAMRATNAMMAMKKLDLGKLRDAYEGRDGDD